MDKYDKYFLPHTLYIQDHFCKFNVQRPGWCPQEILDVQCTIFVHEEDVQNWLLQCLEYDAYETMTRLRVFWPRSAPNSSWSTAWTTSMLLSPRPRI
jgi:hypothetical protein